MCFPRITIGAVLIMVLAALLASATSSQAWTNQELSTHPYRQTAPIVQVIEEVFADEPRSAIETTIRIFMCESGLRKGSRAIGIIRHLDTNGQALQGGDGYDIGAGQIRKVAHTAPWTKRLDPTKLRDNVVYALKLQRGQIAAGYDRFRDWTPSKSCWRHPPLTMAYARPANS